MVISFTLVLKFSRDFARIFTECDVTSNPKKVNPFRNVVTCVLVGLSDRPSVPRNC